MSETYVKSIERALERLGEASYYVALFGGPAPAAELAKLERASWDRWLTKRWPDFQEADRYYLARMANLPRGLSWKVYALPSNMQRDAWRMMSDQVQKNLTDALLRLLDTDAEQLRLNYDRAVADLHPGKGEHPFTLVDNGEAV